MSENNNNSQFGLSQEYLETKSSLVKADWKTNSFFADAFSSLMAWKDGQLSGSEMPGQRGLIANFLELFKNFFNFLFFTWLKFQIYNIALYLTFIIPTSYLFFKINVNPPFYLYLSFYTAPLGGASFLWKDLWIVATTNPLSGIVLFFAVLPWSFTKLVFTRYPSLMFFTAINLLTVVFSVFEGKGQGLDAFVSILKNPVEAFYNGGLYGFFQDPFGNTATVNGMFHYLPPVLLAIISSILFAWFFWIKDRIDFSLGVQLGMNGLGENQGGLIATIFGANNLDIPIQHRGQLSMDKNGKKKAFSFELPRFTSAKEFYVFLIGLRFRLIVYASLFAIGSTAYDYVRIQQTQGPNIFSMTPAQRKVFIRSECVRQAPDIYRRYAFAGLEAPMASSSSDLIPRFPSAAKDAVHSLRSRGYMTNLFVNNFEGGILFQCHEDLHSTFYTYKAVVNAIGIENAKDKASYSRAFDSFYGNYKANRANGRLGKYGGRLEGLDKPEVAVVIKEVAYELVLENKKLKDYQSNWGKVLENVMKNKRKHIQEGGE